MRKRQQHWREEIIKTARDEESTIKIKDSISPYIRLPKIKWEISDWFLSARLNTPLSSDSQGLDRHQELTEAPPISYETEITMSIEKEVGEISSEVTESMEIQSETSTRGSDVNPPSPEEVLPIAYNEAPSEVGEVTGKQPESGQKSEVSVKSGSQVDKSGENGATQDDTDYEKLVKTRFSSVEIAAYPEDGGFTSMVQLDDLKCVGKGRTEDIAKSRACQKLLQKLPNSQASDENVLAVEHCTGQPETDAATENQIESDQKAKTTLEADSFVDKPSAEVPVDGSEDNVDYVTKVKTRFNSRLGCRAKINVMKNSDSFISVVEIDGLLSVGNGQTENMAMNCACKKLLELADEKARSSQSDYSGNESETEVSEPTFALESGEEYFIHRFEGNPLFVSRSNRAFNRFFSQLVYEVDLLPNDSELYAARRCSAGIVKDRKGRYEDYVVNKDVRELKG